MTAQQRLMHCLREGLGASIGDLLGYVLTAGAAWLIFEVAFRAYFRHRRISRRGPVPRQIRREVLHSLRSIAVFGLVTAAVIWAARCGWTRLYPRVDRYGWGWWFLSLPVMVLMHDTWF